MKKKELLLSLFLLPFVTGCSNQQVSTEKLIDIVNNLEPINRNSFSAETKGQIFGVSMNTKGTPKIIESTNDKLPSTKSALFSVALKLDKDKFYYLFDGTTLDATCQYYKIQYQLVDRNSKSMKVSSTILKDGSIKFWSTNSNVRLKNFGHYEPKEGMDESNVFERGKLGLFSGKIDGCYIYDKYGYLQYEEFATHSQSGPDEITAKVSCTYRYYE